jgi:hypothetical protein
MENMVLCQGQSEQSVHSKLHCDRLSRSSGGRDVLGLAAEQSHHLLLDRLPADEALAKEEEDPAGGLVLLLVSMFPVWSLSLYRMKCAASGHLR